MRERQRRTVDMLHAAASDATARVFDRLPEGIGVEDISVLLREELSFRHMSLGHHLQRVLQEDLQGDRGVRV